MSREQGYPTASRAIHLQEDDVEPNVLQDRPTMSFLT